MIERGGGGGESEKQISPIKKERDNIGRGSRYILVKISVCSCVHGTVCIFMWVMNLHSFLALTISLYPLFFCYSFHIVIDIRTSYASATFVFTYTARQSNS